MTVGNKLITPLSKNYESYLFQQRWWSQVFLKGHDCILVHLGGSTESNSEAITESSSALTFNATGDDAQDPNIPEINVADEEISPENVATGKDFSFSWKLTL